MKIPLIDPLPLTVANEASGAGMVKLTAFSVIIFELSESVALTRKVNTDPALTVSEEGADTTGAGVNISVSEALWLSELLVPVTTMS